jgi:hypothetical protein
MDNLKSLKETLTEKKEYKFIKPKSYNIDLDLPESERWNHILNDYKDSFPKMKTIIDGLLKDAGLTPIVQLALSALISYNQNKIMYKDELMAISKATEIEFNKLLFMQLIYEACAACTTVITKVSNEYVFVRTMDWDLPILKEFTITIKVYKDNKLLYIAPTWVGCVGLFTAVNMNQMYAIAINYRRTCDISLISIVKNIGKTLFMYWPNCYLVRHICENNYDHKTAVKKLQFASVVSPCYYTIYSTTEKPIVITRNSDDYNTRTGDFIVQTNCDDDKNEPDILHSLQRREIIKKSIVEHKNNYDSYDQLLKEIIVEPIINDETIYVTKINPRGQILTEISV